jgi:hypothetical protein
VSLSQRVDGERRKQAVGVGQCRLPITTNTRAIVCHLALKVVRRRVEFLSFVLVASIADIF